MRFVLGTVAALALFVGVGARGAWADEAGLRVRPDGPTPNPCACTPVNYQTAPDRHTGPGR